MSALPAQPSLVAIPNALIAHCASFLSVDDVLRCSSLSRSLHAVLDGEEVWRPRCEAVRTAATSQLHLSPSPDLLPPADTVRGACLAAFLDAKLTARQRQRATVEVVALRCESTRRVDEQRSAATYHVKLDVPLSSLEQVRYGEAISVAMELQWSDGEPNSLRVTSIGADMSGSLVYDLYEVDEWDSRRAAEHSLGSSKAQYLAMHRCSEHDVHRCYALSPPLLRPLPPPRRTAYAMKHPVVRPAPFAVPLCASCRQRIAVVIQQSLPTTHSQQVSCLVRLNAVEYDVALSHYDDDTQYVRYRIRRTGDSDWRLRSYKILAQEPPTSCNSYAASLPSNVPWNDPAPPRLDVSSVECAQHASSGCGGRLRLYDQIPYATQTIKCKLCSARRFRPLYHCSQCWFDLCTRCAWQSC